MLAFHQVATVVDNLGGATVRSAAITQTADASRRPNDWGVLSMWPFVCHRRSRERVAGWCVVVGGLCLLFTVDRIDAEISSFGCGKQVMEADPNDMLCRRSQFATGCVDPSVNGETPIAVTPCGVRTSKLGLPVPCGRPAIGNGACP